MLLFFYLIFTIQSIECARILGIFYMPGYSHFILGETLFKELAARGHQVTVVSSFPQKEALKNYKDVPVTEMNEIVEYMLRDESISKYIEQSVIASIIQTYEFGTMFTNLTLQNKNVQKLLKSNETFDLIILEQFLNEAHFGFMHRFKAPLVLISTTSSSYWSNTLMGNPTPYSYIPHLLIDYSPKMNFLQRMYNVFISTFQAIYFYTYALPEQERILHKYFSDAPRINDLIHNASLNMLNSHPTVSAAVPLQPNMIEIGGFHVQKYKPLSDSLTKFLDEAEEGIIYFSLGSNMQSKYLPQEKVQGILKAFSKLKMKVLWKWEDDDLPKKPSNVRIEKWLPQPAVLAHKNVKVFITHGGRLSIIEAIYFGKPLIGIPLFAEQRVNVREAAYLGYGIYLSYQDLDEEHLSKALTEILSNPGYAEIAKYRSDALHGLKETPLDNAIYWLEYVIKHKGVPHLRNASFSLSWYQYLLLDVTLFLLVVVGVLVKLLFIIFSKIFRIKKKKVKTS